MVAELFPGGKDARSEWKKTFKMNREVFLTLANEAMVVALCQHSKGVETSKKLSRVGEVSLAERLQGS